MYLFIKAHRFVFLTSRRYFENEIVVQVHLLLKEANDETEMLALITVVRVVLQYGLECNICIFLKILLGWMPWSGMPFIHVWSKS